MKLVGILLSKLVSCETIGIGPWIDEMKNGWRINQMTEKTHEMAMLLLFAVFAYTFWMNSSLDINNWSCIGIGWNLRGEGVL